MLHFCPSSALPPPAPTPATPEKPTGDKEPSLDEHELEAQRAADEAEDEAHRQARVDVYLLEGGVVFHRCVAELLAACSSPSPPPLC